MNDEETPFDHDDPEIDVIDVGVGRKDDAVPVVDCGEIAARHLLARALGKASGPREPGLYLIVAPSDAWVPALSAIAPKPFLGLPRRGLMRSAFLQPGPEVRTHELRLASGRGIADEICAAVEQELIEGKVVIVVAAGQVVVPPSLRAAADRIILVPKPDRKCLTAVARELDPRACRLNMRGLDFAAVTPTTLRLAYRPDMPGPAFLRRLKAVARTPATKAPPLEALHGVDEVKDWADALATDLTAWRRGRIHWSELSRGLLLAGPPGTGKTTLAAAIGNRVGAAFVACSYAAWQRNGSGHLGDVVKAMARDFGEARERAPSILFIDELDSLGARGGSGRRDDWWRTIINALLEQMDGTIGNEGVILIAATNHPELIDPAILRAGRLEDRIDLGPPDANALARIYADQLTGRLQNGVDLHRIAQASAGLTGADVVRVCKDARRRARLERRAGPYGGFLAAVGCPAAGGPPAESRRVGVPEGVRGLVAAGSVVTRDVPANTLAGGNPARVIRLIGND